MQDLKEIELKQYPLYNSLSQLLTLSRPKDEYVLCVVEGEESEIFKFYEDQMKELITRCENAEKDLDRAIIVNDSLIGERDMLAELVIELQSNTDKVEVKKWLEVNEEFFNNRPPEWFDNYFWIYDGKRIYQGYYEWRQGHNPNRLIGYDGSNISAIGNYVCYLDVPSPPELV